VPPQQRRNMQQGQQPVRVVVNNPPQEKPAPTPTPAASPRNKEGGDADEMRKAAETFYKPDLARFMLALPAKHQEMFHSAARHGARGARDAYQAGGFERLQQYREQQRQEVRDRAELMRRRADERKAKRESEAMQRATKNAPETVRKNTKATDEEREEARLRARAQVQSDPILNHPDNF
jgi:hypothetical protein